MIGSPMRRGFFTEEKFLNFREKFLHILKISRFCIMEPDIMLPGSQNRCRIKVARCEVLFDELFNGHAALRALDCGVKMQYASS